MFPPDCDDLEDTLCDCSGSLSFRDIEYYLQASPSPLCAGNSEEDGKDEDLKHSICQSKPFALGKMLRLRNNPMEKHQEIPSRKFLYRIVMLPQILSIQSRISEGLENQSGT